ncbi:MAG TPA: ABC transporter transmembrane domain-containing protein, partial [Rhodospirillales bacterium]
MRSLGTSPPRQGRGNDLKTLRTLMPYLWPADEPEIRARVVVAMAFLVLAKVINVAVPVFYKYAVDSLTPGPGQVLAVPVMLLVAYGAARILAQAFGELRDAVFARVAQRAIRLAGLRVFRHLHALSLRFHLDRKTGGVARAVERGTKGIESLLIFMLFNVLPTLFEIGLVCVIMGALYGGWFALVTFITMGSYVAWTFVVTEWRIKFRRTMNETDSEANTRAIDSLLNFETVKYFGNEEHEAGRFDAALRAYERAAVKSKTSLSLLNVGQSLIIGVGVTGVMLLAGIGVVEGRMTIGDFVLAN